MTFFVAVMKRRRGLRGQDCLTSSAADRVEGASKSLYSDWVQSTRDQARLLKVQAAAAFRAALDFGWQQNTWLLRF